MMKRKLFLFVLIALLGSSQALRAQEKDLVQFSGVVVTAEDRVVVVVGFTIVGGKIVEMNVLADPERLRGLDVARIDG